MRVLILGGYGNFGARICRVLATRGFEVIAAGRNPERGHQECGFDASIAKVRLDITDSHFEVALRGLGPDVVIHCVGPFQSQGFDVARAALRAGAHYIDLADGRAFVREFPSSIDGEAIAAGLLAVTGASTLPALSSAVIDSLRSRVNGIEEIQISIAPAQRSPRGTATLRAVFSYLGRPIKWLVDGEWKTAIGWRELRRFNFQRIGTRWAAACDVPDLDLLPARYPEVKTVQFRASLEFALEHFLLTSLAWFREIGLPFPMENWVGTMDKVASCLDSMGGPKGGMLVSVAGRLPDARAGRIEWHLTADWDRGPEIPCLPAILLAEHLRSGKLSQRGATACMGLLTLGDFEPEFQRLGIQTEFVEVLE